MDNRPIGIFDSGVGGLSILLEIQKLLPRETIIFVADQSFVPYGGKTKEQLLERVIKIIEFLRKKNVKAVIMACNTATVYTVEEMRQKFQMPIIGTVPVIKTIASISKTKKTAVFSTPATAQSTYLDGLINKFAGGMEVTKVGGTGLEELVEEGELDSPEINAILQKELLPLVASGVDAIALGCTHYPFLRTNIEKIVGKGVTVVDSGGAVSRRVKEVLTNNDGLSEQKGQGEYYTTGEAKKFQRVAEKLMNAKIPDATHISL